MQTVIRRRRALAQLGLVGLALAYQHPALRRTQN